LDDHLRTLERLDGERSLQHLVPLVRRLLKYRPSKRSAVRLGNDVLTAACELDPEFPQPLIRRIQLAPPGQTLKDVERTTEEVLRLSPERYDRGLVISEFASAQLKFARDLSAAANLADLARKEDPSRGSFAVVREVTAFVAGRIDLKRFEGNLISAVKKLSRVDAGVRSKQLARVQKASVMWLSEEGLLQRSDARKLGEVLSRVLP
jgi:hypothetical protein